MPDRKRNQTKAWVGDARHTGVGNERDFRSAFEIDHQLGGLGHLVVLVVADRTRVNSVMGKQFLRLASVLARDQVNFLQHPQRAQRDVFEIANGRGYQVEGRARAQAAAAVTSCCFKFEFLRHIASLARKPPDHRAAKAQKNGEETQRKDLEFLVWLGVSGVGKSGRSPDAEPVANHFCHSYASLFIRFMLN